MNTLPTSKGCVLLCKGMVILVYQQRFGNSFYPQDAVKKKVIPKVIRDPSCHVGLPAQKMARNIQRFFRYTRMTAKIESF